MNVYVLYENNNNQAPGGCVYVCVSMCVSFSTHSFAKLINLHF